MKPRKFKIKILLYNICHVWHPVKTLAAFFVQTQMYIKHVVKINFTIRYFVPCVQ